MISDSIADTVAHLGESEISIRRDNCVQHHDSVNQGLDTPDSLLPISEPPDIKNWFSSYEYESLVLETNDNFGFSDQESEGYGKEPCTENIVENSREFLRSESNDGMMKKKASTMSIKSKQSVEENNCENQPLNQVSDSADSPLLSPEPPGIENWFSSYAYESPTADTIDDLILPYHKENMGGKEECCNEKGKDDNSHVSNDLICNESQRLEVEDSDISSTKNMQNKLPVETNEDSNASCFENNRSKCEAKVEKEDVSDGFIRIKGKREKKEVKIEKTSSFVMTKRKEVRRKVLADVTNVERDESSVSGKWKCPRKSKTDIGPPLKQLRLGQWFHML